MARSCYLKKSVVVLPLSFGNKQASVLTRDHDLYYPRRTRGSQTTPFYFLHHIPWLLTKFWSYPYPFTILLSALSASISYSIVKFLFWNDCRSFNCFSTSFSYSFSATKQVLLIFGWWALWNLFVQDEILIFNINRFSFYS